MIPVPPDYSLSTGKGGRAIGCAASDSSAASLSSPAMRFTRTAWHIPQR